MFSIFWKVVLMNRRRSTHRTSNVAQVVLLTAILRIEFRLSAIEASLAEALHKISFLEYEFGQVSEYLQRHIE